jgi:hypothetical protein
MKLPFEDLSSNPFTPLCNEHQRRILMSLGLSSFLAHFKPYTEYFSVLGVAPGALVANALLSCRFCAATIASTSMAWWHGERPITTTTCLATAREVEEGGCTDDEEASAVAVPSSLSSGGSDNTKKGVVRWFPLRERRWCCTLSSGIWCSGKESQRALPRPIACKCKFACVNRRVAGTHDKLPVVGS